MSYANGTPNYNLPQTVGNDKRDWSDTNPAFLVLDAAVKSASDNATQADGKADAAQTTADSAATTAASAVTTANSASATAQTAAETAQLAQNAATTAQQTATQAATDAQSAQTIANAAQQTASNADTVALQAQSNIGTMSDLQTTAKSSLVAAINEVNGKDTSHAYTSSEKIVGTLNGKNVYEKTYTSNTEITPTSAMLDTTLNSTNIDQLVSVEGGGKNVAANSYIAIGTIGTMVQFYIEIISSGIQLHNNVSVNNVCVTYRYTKV